MEIELVWGLLDACIKGSADSVVDTTSEAFLVLPYYKRGTLHDHLALKSFAKTYLDVRDIVRYFTGWVLKFNIKNNFLL